MKLIDIKRKYDAIFSLGNACLVANRLRHYQLQSYTGVIDWMLSPDLLKVVNLLQNRFDYFMKKENIIWEGFDHFNVSLLLKDIVYNITSVHDFPLTRNTPENWVMYEEFQATLHRRIQRFLNRLDTCKNLLFIRIGGTYEEAKLLEIVLSEMVQGEFRVLLINEIEEYKVVEYDWDLPYTCSIGMPLVVDEQLWDQVLQGMKYSDIH